MDRENRLHRELIQREIERDMNFFEVMVERFLNWGMDADALERRLRVIDAQKKW